MFFFTLSSFTVFKFPPLPDILSKGHIFLDLRLSECVKVFYPRRFQPHEYARKSSFDWSYPTTVSMSNDHQERELWHVRDHAFARSLTVMHMMNCLADELPWQFIDGNAFSCWWIARQFIDRRDHQGVWGAEPTGFAGGRGGAAAGGAQPPVIAGGPGDAAPWYCRGSGGAAPWYCKEVWGSARLPNIQRRNIFLQIPY